MNLYLVKAIVIGSVFIQLNSCCAVDKKICGKIKIQEFFTDLFTIDPVSTEYQAYQLLKEVQLTCSCKYLAIPWAILINTNRLNSIPDFKLAGGFTVCQHIRFEKIIPKLKEIGIDTLFTPHVCKGKIYEGIRVLPFPHYAVHGADPAFQKDIFYSFIGFNTHYTRRIIFDMQHGNAGIVKERKHWHFQQPKDLQEAEKIEYQDVLARSRFSLCPRGTGPSTLRFWESLQAGAIPVLFGDDMVLPEGIEWQNCIIQIKEQDTAKFVEIISLITPEREAIMRMNCLETYKQFSGKNLISVIRAAYEKGNNEESFDVINCGT